MALSKCTECGGLVAVSAASCPHCGAAAPAITRQQRGEVSALGKNAVIRKLGGTLFLIGIGWILALALNGGTAESIAPAWGIAKYLIGGGLAVYVWAEIARNLMIRKRAQ